jgi:hypothetical protein
LTRAAAAAVLFIVSSAAVAQAADALATHTGLDVGAQVAQYEYLEPDIAKLSGNRFGLVGTATLASGSLFGKIDLRGSYARLKYEGSGTMTDVPDLLLEARALAGFDLIGSWASLSPYTGLGYRYLFDDLRGYSSTSAAGYRRYSNYLYIPVGLTARFRLGEDWVLVPTIEADVFLQGKQVSKLSDAGLGLNDVTNTQSSGRGHRASLMIEKNRWSFGVWTNYWHINDSDTQFAGVVNGQSSFGQEPMNTTRESGIELRRRF